MIIVCLTRTFKCKGTTCLLYTISTEVISLSLCFAVMNRRASTLVPNKTEQLLLSKLNRITKTSRKRTRQQHLLCVQLLPSTSHCNDGIMKLNEVSFPPDQTSTCSGEINRLCSPAACVSTAAQTLTTDRAERSSEALLTHERELTVAVRVCQGLHTDRRTKQSHQHFR